MKLLDPPCGFIIGLPVLTTVPYGTLTWNIILALFIIAGILAGIILFIFSKKPKDFRHMPKIEGRYLSGKLRGLVNSISLSGVDYSDKAFLKTTVEKIFFEKIGQNQGLLTQELIELKKKNPNKLKKIINNEEITEWILNSKNKKIKPSEHPHGKKTSKKERYLMDINDVLDKMEAWGE